VKLKKGLWICWLSLVILPIGVLFGAVGMCAGPNSGSHGLVLLTVGFAGIGATIYTFFHVLRGIRAGGWALRLFATLSLFLAIVVGLMGGIYSLEAWDYLAYVFRR